MRTRLLALALAAAALLALPAVGQAKKLTYLTGISDQWPATFQNPAYTQLHMGIARYIAPYDVMLERPTSPDRLYLAQWMAFARAAHQEILVSFEHSHLRNRGLHVPSAREYSRDIGLFLRTFPFVKDVSPWNEVNRCAYSTGHGFYAGQPICHNPRAAATYYTAARKLCRGCRIVALDVLDGRNVAPTVSYIRQFLHYARPFPAIWGIHNYSDTNRFSDSRTRALMAATRHGDIWLTEAGGQVKDGRSFPYSPRRAARALGCMFTIANRFRRIKRVYVYDFNAGHPRDKFDGGLVNLNGTKRPGWYVVQKRQATACRP